MRNRTNTAQIETVSQSIFKSINNRVGKALLVLCLLMASVGAWAQTNANYVPFEFYTSINQITGNFAIVNAAEGKALYGPDAQNIGYADYATAFANNRAVTQYALENAGNGNYRLRCVTPAGGNYGLWGSNPCYLNAQPAIGGVLFNLGLNGQNGQDVENGALWKLNYVEGQGWTIRNVANNGYAAPNNISQNQPYYWQLCSLAEPNVTTNVGYVITYQNNHFLGGTSTTDITTFNPSTCLWTGTSGGSWRNSSGYYIYSTNNNGSGLQLSADNNRTWTIDGNQIYRTGQSRYIRWNNGWTSDQTNSNRNIVYPVSRTFYTEDLTTPTLSGADQIDQLGISTYTRTDASYQPACYDYVFYNGAHHYCTSVTANATATRPSETFTYTWSLLNEDGTAYTGAYVSVDNNGVVNYKTIFSSDTRLTLRLTATSDSKTFTADKAITFKGSCTTPTITFSQSTKTVTISGKTGETIHYTTDDGYSGAAPTAGSPTYSAPINITQRTRIRAIATKANYRDSEIASLVVDNPNSMTPSTTYIGNVTAGNTVQLSYTLSGQPDADVIYDRVVYSSENSTVASVDQTGLVSAKVAGTTNIVMTLYNLDGTVKATQQIGIVVKNPYNDPNSLSVNSNDQTLNQGETWQIVATAYGTEPVYQKFKYEVTGAGGIVSVDETGLVKAQSQGNTQITVTAYNYGDVLSNLTQTINITVIKPTSIDGKTCIYDLSEVTNTGGSYILMDDISASDGLNITFTGTFDGNYHTISGLGSALFSSINGGTVKNVRLDNVSISSGDANGHVGAIANTATGSTRIYNCGVLSTGGNSSVSGSGSVGGIVGHITGDARVVNCFNYAEVSGGEFAGGIVGQKGNFQDPYAGKTFYIRNNGANNRYLSNPDGTLRISDTPSSWIIEVSGTGFLLKNVETNAYICKGTNAWNSTMSTSDASAISFTIASPSNGVYRITCSNGSLGLDDTANNSNVWKDKTYPNNNTSWTIREVGTNTLLTVVNVETSEAIVTNCMMYGDMTSGTNRSPVYGGVHVDNNQRPNEYNYYRSKANLTYTKYNEQGAIDKDEFLTRFPFYRHIMNTHRELAAIKLFGSRTDGNVSEIGHWVLDTKVAPYPIIEKWETNTKRTTVDIAANLPLTSEAYAGKLLTEMGSGGYLNVTVNIGGSSRNVRLPITDMDSLRYDFTWGKVVLPFANEFDGWKRDYSKVITGWKITSITGGTTGTLTNYNFADRDCTAKDLYSNSGYIFAQGGNYIVPYGVTAITIDANFANAYYLSDETYDIGYNENYGGATGLNGNVPTDYHGQTVYTSLNDLMGQLTEGKYTPHEQAIVLVGNYHYNQNTIGGNIFGNHTTKGLTIMSVDEDNNQEPDYGWYSYHTTDRTNIPSLRFDFVPNIGIGMAARVKGSTPYPTIGIWHSKAWFELTETCVSFMSECEIDDGEFTNDVNINNRWIANSGYFIQIVRAHGEAANKLAYLQIGGNAYVEQLYPGPHMAQAHQITLCPINVTGGEIKECFMTGKGSGTPNAAGPNIYFWCAGGRIHKYLSAYMVKPSTAGVNVVAKVDHARIYRFFGGGTSPTARVTGNINVTMNNSLVDFYCGGPEFGDMEEETTVTTNATGSTFGEFYGAGFGGTSTTWVQRTDNGVTFNSDVYDYPSDWGNYTDSYLQYDNSKGGWGSNYDFEYIMYSGGNGQGVGRFYTGYSDFSLAQTGNVTSNLTDCTVLNNFYGGGCQGTVDGNATSTLTNCHIEGNAFAGGYKAPETTVEIYSNIQPTYPIYTRETGLFTFYDKGAYETWRWVEGGTAGTKHDDTKTLETGISFANLGAVTGKATINVQGDTYVAGMIDGLPNGGVFGGGNESPVRGETEVNIATTNTYTIANVYGGANKANVDDNTVVNVTSGTVGNVFGANNVSGVKANAVTVNINETTADKPVIINNNVYGGGNLANYTGTPVVNMQAGRVVGSVFGGGLSAEVDGSTDVNVSGGNVLTAVYGGGALANVTGSTDVSLTGGTVHDVFGGGLGRQEDDEHGITAVKALVEGNTLVTLNGSIVTGSIFGANNLNGTPLGHVKVHVLQTKSRPGQVEYDEENPDNPANHNAFDVPAVYGGGNMAAYEPSDATLADNDKNFAEVVIENCDNSIDYVYGGGNAAPVPGTKVTIWGADAINNVFGGGNGAGEIAPGIPNPGANVGYKADNTTEYGPGTAVVNIYGGTIHSAFGGSNTKGLIRVSAEVNLDERSITGNDADQCPLIIGEVYGAGNEAEMYGAGSLNLGCITGLNVIYGGAKNADFHGDVELNITSGTFGKVFGGNNLGGTLDGSITVNIDETGCHPLIIDELYACGNLAAYETPVGKSEPTINIISCTRIGQVFGAGLGDTTGAEEKATVTGNPIINVNQIPGRWAAEIDANGDGNADNDATRLGEIGVVFGGGNAAKVVGNTNVNVGTEEISAHIDDGDWGTANQTPATSGANITGNIYGGGNQADVTGKTNVTVGQ